MLKGKLYGHPEARAIGKALHSRPTVLHVPERASAATKRWAGLFKSGLR